MAGTNEGFRYIIVVADISNVDVAQYDYGTLVYDSAGDTLSVNIAGAWKIIPFTP